MMKKESTENEGNLKKAFDDSKNVNEMNKVLRNIFSFENFVWMSNQVASQEDINASYKAIIDTLQEINT